MRAMSLLSIPFLALPNLALQILIYSGLKLLLSVDTDSTKGDSSPSLFAYNSKSFDSFSSASTYDIYVFFFGTTYIKLLYLPSLSSAIPRI